MSESLRLLGSFESHSSQPPEDLETFSATHAIIGFRNVLAHAYDTIEYEVMWSIIEDNLETLVAEISAIEEIRSLG